MTMMIILWQRWFAGVIMEWGGLFVIIDLPIDWWHFLWFIVSLMSYC